MSEIGKEKPVEEQVMAEAPALGTPEPTLKDELRHAFKEVVKEAPEGETTAQREDRLRDAQGKFTEKPAQAKTERKPGTLTLPEKTAAPQQTKEAKPVTAPEGWTATAKAKFATLDPEIQAEVVRRETDMHRQFTAQDQDRSLGKKIRETAAPYLATIRAEGGDEGAAFQQFLNYAHIMRAGTPQQKAQALQNVAQLYNVPLGQQAQQPQTHPALQALEAKQRQIDQWIEQQNQQRQNQEQAQLFSEIADFQSSDGHEHFEQVKELMGSLLMSGQAKDLQDAYDKAIWAQPDIRSTLTAQQVAAAEEKRMTEINGKTGAAKWAAGSISGGGPGGAKPNGAAVERSLGDELRANYRSAVNGRI